MLQKLGDHIQRCIEQAARAEARAAEVTDPSLKDAAQWTHLASSYQFAESLERFLLDAQKAKDALEPQAPKQP